MSEVINLQEPQQQGPVQFDPTKKYTWNKDVDVVISGGEFGLLLNSLRAILNTKEAQTILRAADAADVIEGILIKNVEAGVFTEIPDVPKNSL